MIHTFVEAHCRFLDFIGTSVFSVSECAKNSRDPKFDDGVPVCCEEITIPRLNLKGVLRSSTATSCLYFLRIVLHIASTAFRCCH